MSTVKLSSQEGEEFEVPVELAKLSETVKHIMEDIGHEQAIPLPNVTAKILQKVIDYCRYHVEHPAGAEGEKRDDGSFDKEFVKVDQPMLFDLILAANYLDIRPLLDLTCHTVADMIKGKTMDEIRKTFNIKNDFTPEEEEHLKKEIEWVEEK